MTAWAREQVAGFARGVGWRDAELVEAVAIALASSNGRDDLILAVPPPPLHEHVGLWLVPADLAIDGEVGALVDPTVNARAAKRLWLAAGRSWRWSGVFGAGRWRGRLDEARQAVERPRLNLQSSPIAAVGDALARSAALRLEMEQRSKGVRNG